MEMDDLWQDALAALERGDFTRLQELLGGPEGFDERITAWHKGGAFDIEREALAEAFACACFLGRTGLAEYLLDSGVDPVAGKNTGQTGFHYAVIGGHLDTVRLLIERNVPMEVENMYGGTVLGQALWSAVNQPKDSHAAIIEALIEARGKIEPGTVEWWNAQSHTSIETKMRVADALRRAGVK
jgi:hypothetical protein